LVQIDYRFAIACKFQRGVLRYAAAIEVFQEPTARSVLGSESIAGTHRFVGRQHLAHEFIDVRRWNIVSVRTPLRVSQSRQSQPGCAFHAPPKFIHTTAATQPC
jgi:hypothetical protein